MAKVEWPLKEANNILKHRDLRKKVIFETGYGPSGLPHIGTFAEVARTCLVMKALQECRPDLEVQLYVFSDDMDGLRSRSRKTERFLVRRALGQMNTQAHARTLLVLSVVFLVVVLILTRT